jgi:hypothetical protein
MLNSNAFRGAAAITESDSTTYDPPGDAIYVGTTGALTLTINGVDVVFAAVPVGGPYHFGPISKVKAASVAGSLVLLWY